MATNNTNSSFDFSFVEAQFTILTSNVQTYIQGLYNKADQVFSPASPYGQILSAVEMIFHVMLTAVKNVVNQYDLSNPNNLNDRTIRTIATMSGYNPVRAQSATGTIYLQIKPGLTISEDIPGSKLTIINQTRLRNKTNNLDYYVDLGTDFLTYFLDNTSKIYLPLVQGAVQTQIFTGNGAINQSYVAVVPSGNNVEHNRILVTVNGVAWSKRDSLWDLLPGEFAYYTKTGFNGGLEIWFGNNDFGFIPPIGSQISVQYVLTNGANGNLPQNTANDWTFVDDVYDGLGGIVEIENLFFIFVQDEISFGSDAESIRFTKGVLPYISRNFVLARPEQFEFHLRRLNVFSQINAYTTEKGTIMDNNNPLDDSIIYLFLVPDFRNFISSGSNNYFDLPLSAFTLDTTQKNKVTTYLNTQGVVAIGTGIVIVDPTVMLYVINVTIRMFSNYTVASVNQAIIDAISTYFIQTTRRDRIPRSDLIVALENVAGVDSVDVKFVSQANEAYHASYVQFQESILKSNPTANPDLIVMPGYDPTTSKGLDPKLGDIIIEKNQLAVIRGGWADRNGLYYDVAPKTQGLGAVNIMVEETVSQPLNVGN